MKVIEPGFTFITPINYKAVLQRLEQCGRVCYKSEDKITEESAEKFVKMLIERGHESVLEHCTLSVKLTCDRGVSHELVRHRLASYSQESTRYCNYGKDKFGGEITFIKPSTFNKDDSPYRIWARAMQTAETAYFDLLGEGCTPQEARSVLPNSVKTEIIVTANIREWREILRQRTSDAAHPDMRYLMRPLLRKMIDEFPVLFEDIPHQWTHLRGGV